MRPEIFELSDFHQYIDGVFNIIHSLSILLSIIMIDNKIDNDIVCGWAALDIFTADLKLPLLSCNRESKD